MLVPGRTGSRYYPESTRWLSAEEKELAKERLAFEGSHGEAAELTWEEAKKTLVDWRLYAHFVVSNGNEGKRMVTGRGWISFIDKSRILTCTNQLYFGISTPFSSLSLFTPSITTGLGFSNLRAQLMTVPPYATAYVVTIFVAWSADHFNA
jgi:hypothetical protein